MPGFEESLDFRTHASNQALAGDEGAKQGQGLDEGCNLGREEVETDLKIEQYPDDLEDQRFL